MKNLILILMLTTSFGYSQGTVKEVFLATEGDEYSYLMDYQHTDEVIETENYITLIYKGRPIVHKIMNKEHDSVFDYYHIKLSTMEATMQISLDTASKYEFRYRNIIKNKNLNQYMLIAGEHYLIFDLWRKNAQ